MQPGTETPSISRIFRSMSGILCAAFTVFMWTFTRSVKIHILQSCSFPDWDGTFRDNSSQPFRKLSRVFGESEVLEPRVNVTLARRHKESITQAKYLNFINRNLKFVKCSTSTSSVKDASGIRAHQKKKSGGGFHICTVFD